MFRDGKLSPVFSRRHEMTVEGDGSGLVGYLKTKGRRIIGTEPVIAANGVDTNTRFTKITWITTKGANIPVFKR